MIWVGKRNDNNNSFMHNYPLSYIYNNIICHYRHSMAIGRYFIFFIYFKEWFVFVYHLNWLFIEFQQSWQKWYYLFFCFVPELLHSFFHQFLNVSMLAVLFICNEINFFLIRIDFNSLVCHKFLAYHWSYERNLLMICIWKRRRRRRRKHIIDR